MVLDGGWDREMHSECRLLGVAVVGQGDEAKDFDVQLEHDRELDNRVGESVADRPPSAPMVCEMGGVDSRR
jgi:hypothetical protein